MDLVTLSIAKKYTRDKIAEAAVGGIDIEEYVTEKIAEVIDSAPEALNTLNALAEALGDDPNYAATIATQIGGKVDKVSGKGLSTNDFTNAYKTKLDAALTSYTETDPTVPAWAKEPNKPTYTAEDVGALPNTTTLFSGNYNDLTNKPTIPSIDGLATETYVDNAVANKEFILNSTTEGSTKKFRVTVDDSGVLTAVEITE